jgi:hypothetical protein
MTTELAPIFYGMVVLLVITGSAIAVNAFGSTVVARVMHFTKRDKRRLTPRGRIVPASA